MRITRLLPIAFPVDAATAFDYLADPANRPQWQSSLRRVEAVAPAAPGLGQRWVDVTAVGLRPAMVTTLWQPGSRWAESGVGRSVRADLSLDFAESTGGCAVTAEVAIAISGPGRALEAALLRGASLAIPADLRRAAAVLGRQPRR